MKDKIILEFADWYINNIEGKSSSYFSNYFQSNKELFIIKLTEYGVAFEQAYSFNPFNAEFSDEFISKIYTALKSNHQESFKEYNAKNQNGGPRALLGSKNYLRFLNEKLNTNIPLETDFREFMSGFNDKNQKDYLNYVKNANKILDYRMFGLIKEIIGNNDYEKLESLRTEGVLLIKQIDSTSKGSYASGFKKYLEFIEEYISDTLNDDEDIEEITIIDAELDIEPEFENLEEIDEFQKVEGELSKDEIKENFYFRLITQNRFNKCGLFFPISFLKQYFYKTGDKDYFDKIINRQIFDIEFIGKDKNTIGKISELKSMSIDNEGKVYINDKQVFSNNIETDNAEAMIVSSLSEITIDHKESMDSILKNLKDNNKVPELSKISDRLKKKLRKPLTYNKLRSRGTQLSKEKEFIDSIDKAQLKLEFEAIVSKMNLELMHKKHNNHKRAK